MDIITGTVIRPAYNGVTNGVILEIKGDDQPSSRDWIELRIFRDDIVAKALRMKPGQHIGVTGMLHYKETAANPIPVGDNSKAFYEDDLDLLTEEELMGTWVSLIGKATCLAK